MSIDTAPRIDRGAGTVPLDSSWSCSRVPGIVATREASIKTLVLPTGATADYALMSDSAGNASWQPLSTDLTFVFDQCPIVIPNFVGETPTTSVRITVSGTQLYLYFPSFFRDYVDPVETVTIYIPAFEPVTTFAPFIYSANYTDRTAIVSDLLLGYPTAPFVFSPNAQDDPNYPIANWPSQIKFILTGDPFSGVGHGWYGCTTRTQVILV